MKGFTLIELVITVAIVALLAAMAAPLAEVTMQRQREQDLRKALRDIREAIDAYKKASDDGIIEKKADESGYPPSLQALVDGAEDKRKKDAPKVFFLRKVPRDPFASGEWGLRSYESTAADPKPGKDVFDVFSLSAGTGLNGIPHKEW